MEQKQKTIINIVYYALIVGILYLAIKYLLPACLPFIFGAVFAFFAVIASRKFLKREKKVNVSIALIIIYLLIVLIVGTLLSIGIINIVEFFKSVPTLYKEHLEPIIKVLEDNITNSNNNLPSEVNEYLVQAVASIFDSFKSLVLSASAYLVSVLTAIIAGAPDVLIDVTIMIISSFYFAFDYNHIISFFMNIIPQKTKGVLFEINDFIRNKLFKIIKSYGLIMLLTFVELSIGLTLLGIKNSVILSFLISVLDILPILGVGTVLLPWGIICMFVNKIGLGIGILVMYIIITFIRNIIEPKLVGGELGLHPLATLVAMIIGLRLFGILGMMIVPIVLSFIIAENKK